MSLKIATTFANELSAPEAVHKICEVQYHAPDRAVIIVGVWANERASKDPAKPYIERRNFHLTGFNPKEITNLHTQIYGWLKTLEAYSGVYKVTQEVVLPGQKPREIPIGDVVVQDKNGTPWTRGEDYDVVDGNIIILEPARGRDCQYVYETRRHEPAVDI